MHLRSCILLIATLCTPAIAQSFNIDLGSAGTTPASTFGAGASQPGFWNAVTPASPGTVSLSKLDGTASGVNFTRTTAGTFSTNVNSNLTGDFDKLLNDAQTNSTLTYSFTGLQNGYYLVLTYALDTDAASLHSVDVGPANGQVSQTSGGPIPIANTFAAGKTHTLHCSFVTSGSLTINISSAAGAQCAGIQLVKIATTRDIAFRIKTNATGNSTGLTWNDAFTSYAQATDAINRLGPGFSVWFAAGSHKPTTGTDRSASFKLASDTQYYGGFAGTESSISQRVYPYYFNQTILSGAIGSTADTDNCSIVVDASNTNKYTVFDGFTVAHGYNNTSGKGGGILLDGSFARVTNCRFLYNFASAAGGAVSITSGYPTLLDCYFLDNTTIGSGGAINAENLGTVLDLINCQFLGNQANLDGGAVRTSNAALRAVNCLFSGNSSGGNSTGGALHIAGNDSSLLTSSLSNCSFTNNRGYQGGGAVYATKKSAVNIYNSILWNDQAFYNHPADETGTSANSSVSFTNSTVTGKAGTDGLDPMFVNAIGNDNAYGTADDNLRLEPGSPCIDTARAGWIALDVLDYDDDGQIAEPFPVDLDHKPRQSDILGAADGPNAGTPAPDRGCFELQMPGCPADINHDTQVDLSDFFDFFNAWDIASPAADLDLSGQVDLADFFLFFNLFDNGC